MTDHKTIVKSLLGSILRIEGDPTVQVVDLLLFVGYFGVCIFAGGISYALAYNSEFNMDIIDVSNKVATVVLFVNKVLLEKLYIFFPAILYLLVFIVLYYLSRYVWRPWFGFFLLSFLLYFTFLGCGFVGKYLGRYDAKNDRLENFASKPNIRIISTIADNDFNNGNYRFLAENDSWMFVFEPVGMIESQVVVSAVRKSTIVEYEVTAK